MSFGSKERGRGGRGWSMRFQQSFPEVRSLDGQKRTTRAGRNVEFKNSKRLDKAWTD